MPHEYAIRRGAIRRVDVRDEFTLHEVEELRAAPRHAERGVGLSLEVARGLRGREVAHPVGVGDGDDDHLRNHEGRVDPRAEDLQQPRHGVEVRVTVQQVQHGIPALGVGRVAVRRRRIDEVGALLLERGE
jgi:hypothetical protein